MELPPLVRKDLVDMHCHSTASDGTLAPYELVLQAHRRGVRALALTDHDSVAGLTNFTASAPRYDIWAIPGVELSAELDGRRLHLVGLGLRRSQWPALEETLAEVRTWRQCRNELMVEKLQALGVEVTLEQVMAEQTGPVLARPHFARALARLGVVSSMDEAFRRYLGKDGAAYVAKQRLTPGAAVAHLKQAGALVIVAHPNSLVEPGPGDPSPVLEELLDAGIDGVEAYHPDMSPQQTRWVLGFAQVHKLLVSAGSDFHGRNKKGSMLGRGHGGRKLFAEAIQPLLDTLQERPTY